MADDEAKSDWFSDARAALEGPLLWLGVGVGAASGITAVARLLHVGLTGVFLDFVHFYRGLMSPLYAVANWPQWPFHVPEVAVDLFAMYAILVGMGYRYRITNFRNARRLAKWDFLSEELPLGFKLRLLGKCLLLVPFLFLQPLRNFRAYLAVRSMKEVGVEDSTEETVRAVEMVRAMGLSDLAGSISFIALPVAIIIFFLLNAYAPTLPL